jgi:hypothetical protein
MPTRQKGTADGKEKENAHTTYVRNIIYNVFAICSYLLGNPYSPIQLHALGTLLWRQSAVMSPCNVPNIFPPILTNFGLSTDFNGSPRYQISPKSVQWQPR